MNAQSLIPLVATIAYIPLFVILLVNRPWQLKQRLFFLLLIPAILWSISDFFFRSGFFMQDKLSLARIVLCTGIWMPIQYRYLMQSFYKSQVAKIPFAYIILAATITLAALGYIPRDITVTGTGIDVNYGNWLFLIAGILFIIVIKDLYYLIRKLKVLADAVKRNQIIYLFTGLACLAIFGIATLAFSTAGRYPISHIGNFLNALILTYAVVTHRLVDIRVVFRKALVNVMLYGGGIATLLLLFWLAHGFFNFELNIASLTVVIGLGIPAILFLVKKVRDIWQRKVEEAFVGARYSYRRQLSQFVSEVQNVPSLEKLGSEFISLLAQSLNCQRACLLLPEAEEEDFSARFAYPTVNDNPMRQLKLRRDSPIVTWLERESTILPERNLAIFPEFQSIWEEERKEIRLAGVNIFVPLMNKEKLVAVLAISEKQDGRFYAVEDIDLIEFITTRMAASIAKEHSREQLKEQEEAINLVNRLTTIITSSTSIHTIFEAFIQELRQVVDIDWSTIVLIDGNELHLLALSSTIDSARQMEERIPLEGTATEWVCQERKSLYEPDLARYHRFWIWESLLQQGIRSVVYLPLSVTDRTIGSLILASRKPDAYSRRQIKLLERVALQIAAPVENAQLYAQVEQKSRIDELTGLFNRRHFEERLKEEVSRHSRYGHVFSIIMLDLDNFKTYNDVYGHPAGDILLGQVGKIIKSSLRNVDQAFRYGGDEFVAIMPETSKEDAYVVAERVREQIATEMEKMSITVTCSIGLASYPEDGVLSGELIVGADTALYYAKWTGGNRSYLYSNSSSELVGDGGIYGKRNGLSAVYALVSVVEARDPYVYGHSRKVNTYAVALAEAIGLSPDEVSKVSTAALLHDIGKIGIPDKVLNKKGKLDEENWQAVKAHAKLGANIASNIPNLVPCVSSILYHHERWDGGGYPEGLKGEEIPIGARILAIADTFEAMTAARPYRPAFPRAEVIKELRKDAGSKFDPKLVEVFVDLIEAGFPDGVKTGQATSSEQMGP
jgi:diguanylate cyclase (GGDEF)-like protein/putative nucleotidyltransferase with HDIG domain